MSPCKRGRITFRHRSCAGGWSCWPAGSRRTEVTGCSGDVLSCEGDGGLSDGQWSEDNTRSGKACPPRSAGLFLGVVTDLAEVFRLGTAKAEENLAFRRYLSAHHYADKPFQILASEVQRHVDCTACSNCCRHSVVSVNKPEIENIARHLGTTPEAVTRLYTVPDPDAPASRILLNSRRVRLPGRQPLHDLRSSPKDLPHLPFRRGRQPLARRPPVVAGPLGRTLSNHLQRARKLQAPDRLPPASAVQHNFQAARLNSGAISLPKRSAALLAQESQLQHGRPLPSAT